MREERRPEAEPEVWGKGAFPPGVEVFDVQGPLFFGAAQRFEESLKVVGRRPRAVIVRIAEVGHIDATGLHALEQFSAHCRARGIRFLLAGVQPQPKLALERSGLARILGEGNLAPTVEAAVERLEAHPG